MRLLYLIILSAALASCGGSDEKQKETPATTQPVNSSPNVMPVPDAANAAPAAPVMPARPPGGITVNEQRGLDEIVHFYGGKTKWSIGDTKGGKQYFRIEISNSISLDSNKQITELSAANIALLLYKDLREERSLYSDIRSVIVYGDRTKIVKTYPVDNLEIALSKMLVTMGITNILKDKKYDELRGVLNDKNGIGDFNKDDLISKVKKAEQSLGPVKEFIPYGFMFVKAKNNRTVLHISGVLVRTDGRNNEFSVDFDATSKKDEAIFLNYKL